MTATNAETTTPLVDDRPETLPSTAVVPVTTPRPAPTPPVAEPSNAEAPTSTLPGAGLVAEAELAIDERRWRDALRVIDAIEAIDATSVHTDGLVAIAATHLRKRRLADEAVGRLRAHPSTPQVHRHLARVALARQNFVLADSETRALFALDDAEPTATDWANLAASYAGLGWFEQAADCLDRAEKLGVREADTWIIGRSVNRWGLSKTIASLIGVALFIFVGLLALAVAITVPFIARELRLTQVDERFAALASDAWAEERWLRLGHAAAVLATVVVWSIVMQLT